MYGGIREYLKIHNYKIKKRNYVFINL